jgi:hypothetical protein
MNLFPFKHSFLQFLPFDFMPTFRYSQVEFIAQYVDTMVKIHAYIHRYIHIKYLCGKTNLFPFKHSFLQFSPFDFMPSSTSGLRAALYVCIYVCMYACMYVCMYVAFNSMPSSTKYFETSLIRVCMYVFIWVSKCVCMYVCMFLCVCMYVFIHIGINRAVMYLCP